MNTLPSPNVTIVGGGPAGLLASILLHKRGIRCTVLESCNETEEWSSKSYSININPRGLKAMETAGVLEHVRAVALERNVVVVESADGSKKVIPNNPPSLSVTRHSLVECLNSYARKCKYVTVMNNVNVKKVRETANGENLINVVLDDGSTVCSTHVIGADGKWSVVRESFSELKQSFSYRTEPSWGIHIMSSFTPTKWRGDATYVFKPNSCPFYIIASPLSTGECSMMIVCFDHLLKTMPWMAPREEKDITTETFVNELSNMLQRELPYFFGCLGSDSLKTVFKRRRVTWLEPSPDAVYSTSSGRVALIGDAAHAMSASKGEGCNTALESAVALASMLPIEDDIKLNMLSDAFIKYGKERPGSVIPIQIASAEASRRQK